MRPGVISILTGWSGRLGSGHIQRMALLADYLNSVKKIPARIISGSKPGFLPHRLHDYFIPSMPPECRCVIRDMRDSEISEMSHIKKTASVITIDDCGPGRGLADLAVDLLPNLLYTVYSKGTFIYGFNFTEALKQLGGQPVNKTIDVALYCGFGPSPEHVDRLLSYVPGHLSCAIIAGDDSRLVIDGVSSPLTASYAETILSSRSFISHFGISLFEGHIAACRLVSVNPTDYHSRLADKAAEELGLLNLGIEASLQHERAALVIDSAARQPIAGSVEPLRLVEIIDTGLDRFFSMIMKYI